MVLMMFTPVINALFSQFQKVVKAFLSQFLAVVNIALALFHTFSSAGLILSQFLMISTIPATTAATTAAIITPLRPSVENTPVIALPIFPAPLEILLTSPRPDTALLIFATPSRVLPTTLINFPPASSSGPIAATTNAITAIVFCCPSLNPLNLSVAFAMACVMERISGVNCEAKLIPADSNAPLMFSTSPARLSSILSAISCAAPSAFLKLFVILVRAPDPRSINACIPDKAFLPYSVTMAFSFCSWVIPLNLDWSCATCSLRDIMLPLLSKNLTPNSSIVSLIALVGAASRDNAPRRDVPAWLPLIPWSDIMPIAAAVSSREIPNEEAMGAAYFIASPMSATSAFVSAAALANASATCTDALASKLKDRMVVAITSAALATSPPDTAARFNTPGIPAMISLALYPAVAKFSIPAADSEAENTVSAPSWMACLRSFSNSSSVAPAITLTRDISLSKSEAVLTEATPTPVTAAVMPIIFLPAADTLSPAVFILSPYSFSLTEESSLLAAFSFSFMFSNSLENSVPWFFALASLLALLCSLLSFSARAFSAALTSFCKALVSLLFLPVASADLS